MSNISKNRMRLMQGASTLLLASLVSGPAFAQTVEIAANITVNGAVAVDSATSSDQRVTKNVTGIVSGVQNTLSGGDLTNGSLSTDGTGAKTGASGVGNTDTLTVSDTDGAANATSTVLTARQSNTGASGTPITVSATTSDTLVSTTVGDTTGGNYTIKNITDTATATGNTVAQTLTLGATALTLSSGNATGDTVGTQDLDAIGEAVAASLQLNTFAKTTATNSGSTIKIDAGDATSSAIKLDANTQESTATGSTAANGIALSGTTVGAKSIIVAQQENDADSTVTAATTASALLTADSVITGGSAAVTNNKIQSRATGATTTNTMTVDATGVTLAAPDTDVAATLTSGTGTGSVEAAYATLNDQLVSGSVSATTTGETSGSAIKLNVDTDVDTGSTLTNDANTVMARAQGAVTANATTIAVNGTFSQGTTVAGATANAATVANVQQVAANADVTAKVDTTAADTITTTIGDDVLASSVSTSSNKLQAYADGTAATNTLTASATTFALGANTTGGASADYGSTASTAKADAAFSIANVQTGGDSDIKAVLQDPATVATTVVGDVTGSSIASNSNSFDAFANSNKAANTLALSATTTTTDAAIISAQTSGADVLASIGYAPGANASDPMTAGTATSDAGVTMNLSGPVDDSSIAVNGNVTRGSATGNAVANTLTSSANTLNGDGTTVQAAATGDNTGKANATADYALASSQILDGTSSSTTQIAASYGIDQADDLTLSDSRLSVSGNVQFGEAIGNSASNRIALTATDAGAGIDPTAAISNVQDGDTATVSANSRMTAYVNAAADNSAVALNNNANTALGVINNAANTLTVSANTLDGATSTASVATGTDTVTADYALGNFQTAGGTLSSTATSTLFNSEKADTTTAGTSDSRVALNGNATTAEASANRVANAVQISALDNGATAALGNAQTSAATVDATATTSVGYTMQTADTKVALSASSVNLDGNSTTALARGNTANNSLNYSVGASYTGLEGAVVTGVTSAAATAVVLNDQANTGDVTAKSENASYAIVLNSGANGTAMSNSSASLSNNTVNALAYGNSAVNNLTMGTFGAGLPSSAISNVQTNGGVIKAEASNVTFNMGVTGTSTGSVIRNTGNGVTAQAVGNSSVSTIGGV